MNPKLSLQSLRPQADQVLVVAALAVERNPNRQFSPGDISSLYRALRIPAPTNIHRVLEDLVRRRHVLKIGRSAYSLTPAGEYALSKQIGIRLTPIDIAQPKEAELAGSRHHVIPPELAPQSLAEPISRFLSSNPFENNVFGISRYPRDENDPVGRTLEIARSALKDFGLRLHLASDRSVAAELWPNVAAPLWASKFGLVIIENLNEEGVNENVLIEVGAMLATGRRCVLLKDTTVDNIPTDLIGHIYKPVDLRDETTVVEALESWCRDDLELPRLNP